MMTTAAEQALILGEAGLTEEEATARLQRDGRNEVATRAGSRTFTAIAHQLLDIVIVVLLVAAALTAAVGDFTDMAVIAAVIVVNTALGASQEVRSDRALAALAKLTAPHTVVVRDGRAREIDTAEVVRGDLVRLAAGDIVPADARVLRAESVQFDESAVTGESVPVGKRRGEPISAGTVVTRGRADAVVTAVASATTVGGIAASLQDTRATQTPMQLQLADLGKRLAAGVIVAAVVVAVLNLIAGRGAEVSVVLAISLAVAAIPESLPAVVSLSLSMAARRMSALGVLIRRLPAVEALGSVTVLAADKTGTLTLGRMTVEQLWTPAGSAAAESALLSAATLCSDACRTADGTPAQRDDPIEVAIVEAAAAGGVDIVQLRADFPRVSEVPFDAAAARMTTEHVGRAGESREICKGSPEAVLDELPDAETARRAAAELAAEGLRVLAVREVRDGVCRVLGLIGFRDPPRATAAQMIASFRRAGVRPVMITGDHTDTARKVAASVGIDGDGLYARVRPDGKKAIVSQLRDEGEVVAMTGDGVNDAPALRAASVGVAVGERATEVARQAADIVLTTDDLSPLVRAIAEGRRAFDNVRRFLHYALGGGVAEVLIMLVGPLFGFAVPLQAGQILWVNLLTHGLPGVAMGNEPAARDVLDRPPRPPGERMLDARTARDVGMLAAVVAATCLVVGGVTRALDRPWQSSVFVTLTLAQLGVALALRPPGTRWRVNLMLPAAVALNVALIVLAVQWGPLQELLHTQPLGLLELLGCLAAAVVPALVAWWQRRRRASVEVQPHVLDT
jgi:Ca2+-transporting ATPase